MRGCDHFLMEREKCDRFLGKGRSAIAFEEDEGMRSGFGEGEVAIGFEEDERSAIALKPRSSMHIIY
jgi:hypothetical protein